MKNHKGSIGIIVGILIAIAIFGGAYYFYSNKAPASNEIEQQPIASQNTQSKYKDEVEKQFPFIVASKSEIINWGTYMNEKYGYSIKFPSTYKITKSGYVDGVGVMSKESQFYGIDIFPNTVNLENLDAFYAFAENEYKPGWKIGVRPFYSLEKVLVNGAHGALVTYKNNDTDIYYRILLYVNSKIINIEFSSKSADKNLLEKIVSTFKFDI